MALRSEKRSTASLAGWLFADLSIVLMILFASTGLTSNDLKCEKVDDLIAESPCKKTPVTTSTIDPDNDNGGVRFQPIVVTVERARSLTAAAFQLQIEKKILQQAESNAELRTAPSWDYGVILIYGGARGRKNSGDGDRTAEIALSKIKQARWNKVRDSTFYEPGHDMSVPYGSVKMKLFPIISK
jgi:hypothetical protein